MRNWNALPAQHTPASSSRFQRTYEELKPSFGGIYYFWRWYVFSVPMRNWNGNGVNSVSLPRKFSAYLWGIETPVRRAVVIKFAQFSGYLWGIETNYNHNRQFGLPCFQRTYEELKRKRRKGRCMWSEAVFSAYLWGIETNGAGQGSTAQLWFSAYLWGIETCSESKYLFRRLSFSAYLWGIETTTEDKHFPKFRYVFSVPMRNWN